MNSFKRLRCYIVFVVALTAGYFMCCKADDAKTLSKAVESPKELKPNNLSEEEKATALALYSNMKNAAFCDGNEALFNLKDISVHYQIDEGAHKLISEEEARTKFELEMRRNNVPINPESANRLVVVISASPGTSENPLIRAFTVTVVLKEMQWLLRGTQCRKSDVTVWERGSYGWADASVINEKMRKEVTEIAELFANGFLSANKKVEKHSASSP